MFSIYDYYYWKWVRGEGEEMGRVRGEGQINTVLLKWSLSN